MSKIQGYQMMGQVTAMDTDASSKHFVAGGRQSINVFEINTEKQYWLQSKHSIKKHKNSTYNKPFVSDIAWNKYGSQYLAIATTFGFVFVYDLAQQRFQKAIFSIKGLDSVKKILWAPNSMHVLYSSSNDENCILKYDIRMKDYQLKVQQKYDYDHSVRFRDLKFNPFQHNVLAAGHSSDIIELFDVRKLNKAFISTSRGVVDQTGSLIDWDPHNQSKLASAGSKVINFWDWKGSQLKKQVIFDQIENTFNGGDLTKQEDIDHVSIKTFKLLQQQNTYAISDKYINFYNRKNPNIASAVFAGNTFSINCWLTNNTQQLIISASMTQIRDNLKPTTNQGSSLIMVQFKDNAMDPNQQRLNHPLTYDCNNNLSLTMRGNIVFSIEPINSSEHCKMTLKEQLKYLHNKYLRIGKDETIAENNSKLAEEFGKSFCAQMWLNIFSIAFPQQYHEQTLNSIFQQKATIDVKIIENRAIIQDRNQLKRKTLKFDVQKILQEVVDQNELQTAVIASICLLKKNKSTNQILTIPFLQRIIRPYIQILNNLELYVISLQTVAETGLNYFIEFTKKNTQFSIYCGQCEKSITKKLCKCTQTCIICKQPLQQKMVIWCKYCGHATHASCYERQILSNKKCLYSGCIHQCFYPDKILY